jgi:hypothetical protein
MGLLIRDSSQVGGAGIALPNTTAGYVASTLNYYEEFSTSLALTGLTGVADLAVQVVRVGKSVNLSWNSTGAGTGQGTTITTAAIPNRFWPSSSRAIAIPVEDNALQTIGIISVGANGVLTFSGDGTTFNNAAAAQIYGGSISYNVI